MRSAHWLTTSLAAVVLAAGACTGPAGTPGTPATSAASPHGSTAVATSTPAPSITTVSARVSFDGKVCSYTGPTVIPFPATLTVEYAPTPAEEGSMIGIMAVHSGTSEAQLEDPSLPEIGAGTPPFVYMETHVFSQGSGSFEYRAADSGLNPLAEMTLKGKPYDTFVLLCLPEMPGQPVGGFTFLHVVEAGA